MVERFPNGRFWARFPISGAKGAVMRMRVVHKGSKKHHVIEVYGMELEPQDKEPSAPRGCRCPARTTR